MARRQKTRLQNRTHRLYQTRKLTWCHWFGFSCLTCIML